MLNILVVLSNLLIQVYLKVLEMIALDLREVNAMALAPQTKI